MPLDKYDITKRNDEWRLEKSGMNRARRKAPTKTEAMQKMQDYMRTHEGSVRIHKANGQIQEERTYPRSKDPKGTKG